MNLLPIQSIHSGSLEGLEADRFDDQQKFLDEIALGLGNPGDPTSLMGWCVYTCVSVNRSVTRAGVDSIFTSYIVITTAPFETCMSNVN